MPKGAAEPLVRELLRRGRVIPGVVGAEGSSRAVAAEWSRATGREGSDEAVQRLHRLSQLAPAPARGRPRGATIADVALLQEWLRRFGAESGAPVSATRAAVLDRLGYDGWLLWDDASGRPVSLAGLNRTVAGMTRIGPVYTPPDARGHGFAAAVTWAAARAALDRGTRDVVLFTDVRNGTSNRLYARLGFVPVEDRLTIRFEPAPAT